MIYINWKYQGDVETVDEFESRKEARSMLEEYQLAFTEGFLYLSQRPCVGWGEL